MVVYKLLTLTRRELKDMWYKILLLLFLLLLLLILLFCFVFAHSPHVKGAEGHLISNSLAVVDNSVVVNFIVVVGCILPMLLTWRELKDK